MAYGLPAPYAPPINGGPFNGPAATRLAALLAARPTGGAGLGPPRIRQGEAPPRIRQGEAPPRIRQGEAPPRIRQGGAPLPPGIHLQVPGGPDIGLGMPQPSGGAGLGPGDYPHLGGVPHQHPVLRGPVVNPGGPMQQAPNPEGGVTPHPPVFGGGPPRPPGVGTPIPPVNPEGGVSPHPPTFPHPFPVPRPRPVPRSGTGLYPR